MSKVTSFLSTFSTAFSLISGPWVVFASNPLPTCSSLSIALANLSTNVSWIPFCTRNRFVQTQVWKQTGKEQTPQLILNFIYAQIRSGLHGAVSGHCSDPSSASPPSSWAVTSHFRNTTSTSCQDGGKIHHSATFKSLTLGKGFVTLWTLREESAKVQKLQEIPSN